MMAAALASMAFAAAASAAPSAPSGLTVDWQTEPALGVSTAPLFGWIVPPCSGSKDAMQTGYQLSVYKDGQMGTPLWDSGKVAGNVSVGVKYSGPPLTAGAAYQWTVTTTQSGCTSAASAPATFITALSAFHPDAKWIGAGVSNATFNLVRRVVKAPAGSKRVIGYVTAQNSDPTMLMNYKLYVNGVLASTGPGRGEAPVTGGDGKFRAQPYITVDLTEHFQAGGPTLLALQTMEFGGFQPCKPHSECNGATQVANGPAVLMQIDAHPSGGGAPTTFVTEAASWKAMDADDWFRPSNKGALAADGAGGRRGQLCVLREARPFHGRRCEVEGTEWVGSGSAGTGRIEFTDARNEPVGWRDSATFDDSKWPAAVAISTPSLVASELTPRMAGPASMIIDHVKPVRTAPAEEQATRRNSVYDVDTPSAGNSFFLDFGKEFQGGLRLHVKGGKAGQTVKFQSGEMCTPMLNNNSHSCNKVQQDWQVRAQQTKQCSRTDRLTRLAALDCSGTSRGRCASATRPSSSTSTWSSAIFPLFSATRRLRTGRSRRGGCRLRGSRPTRSSSRPTRC